MRNDQIKAFDDKIDNASIRKSDCWHEQNTIIHIEMWRMSSEKIKIRTPKSPDNKLYGVPEGIRTPDLLIRSQALYPAELRAHRR